VHFQFVLGIGMWLLLTLFTAEEIRSWVFIYSLPRNKNAGVWVKDSTHRYTRLRFQPHRLERLIFN